MAQYKITFFLVAATAVNVCAGIQLPDVYWNSSNPMFSNVEPPVLSVWMKDRIHIQCPHFKPNQPNADFAEYLTIYQVSKWGFENCVLDGSSSLLMRCSSPFAPTRPLSITFREWTPNPTAPEFQPGRSYYFISTSGGSKTSLSQTSGGLCASKGLRMKIDVNGYRKKKPVKRFQLDQPMFVRSSAETEPPTTTVSPFNHAYHRIELVYPPQPDPVTTLPNPTHYPPQPDPVTSPKLVHFKKARYDYLSADQPQTYNEYQKYLETRNRNFDTNLHSDKNLNGYGHVAPAKSGNDLGSRVFGRMGYDGLARHQRFQYPDRRDYLVESMDEVHRDGLEQIEILVGYAESQTSASSRSVLRSISFMWISTVLLWLV